MSARFDAVLELVRRMLLEPFARLGSVLAGGVHKLCTAGWQLRWRLTITALLAACAYGLYLHPPFATVPRSEVLARTNVFDGAARAYTAGAVLVLPGIHQVRRLQQRFRNRRQRLLDLRRGFPFRKTSTATS